MGAVTASVLIGSMHPNDGTICPTHHALLWEGSRAAWELRSLRGDGRVTTWHPRRHDEVVTAYLAMLAVRVLRVPTSSAGLRGRAVAPADGDRVEVNRLAAATLAFQGLAMAVTIHDPASALRLDDVQAFGHRDLMVATPEWSRIWSRWSGEWEVRGRSGGR